MSNPNVSIFNEPNIGLKVGYPRGWKRYESEELAELGGVVCFSPKLSGGGMPPEVAFNVMLQHGEDDSLDLDKYTSMSLRQLKQLVHAPLQSVQERTLGGARAHSIEYTMPNASDSGDVHFFQCWLVRAGFAVIVTLSAPAAEFSTYAKDLEACLSLFELSDTFDTFAEAEQHVTRVIKCLYAVLHVDKKHHFELYYPSGWLVSPSTTARVFRSEYQGPLSPAKDEPEVMLSIDLSVDASQAWTLSSLTAHMRRLLSKVTLKEEVPIEQLQLGGEEAYAAELGPTAALRTGARNGNERARVYLTWAVHNEKAFVFACTTTEPEEESRGAPLFARILASFKFVEEVDARRARTSTRRYEDLLYSVKIDYPDSLTAQEGFMGATVSFVQNSVDSFGRHVNLVCNPLASIGLSGDMDEFTATLKAQLLQFVANAKILEERETELGGEKARLLVYKGDMDVFTVKFYQVYTVRNRIAYMLSFVTQERHFDAEFEEIKRVCFDSFEFTD